MKSNIDYHNKIIFLEKPDFTNNDYSEKIIYNLSLINDTTYKIVLKEIGENLECGIYNYYSIYRLLSDMGYKNVYVITESFSEDYISFLKKEFGFIAISYFSFFDFPNCYNTFGEIECRDARQNWQRNYNIKLFKHIKKHFLTLNRSYRNSAHGLRLNLYNFLKDNDLLKISNASFRFVEEFDTNFDEKISDIEEINTNADKHSNFSIKNIYENSFLYIITESSTNRFLNVKIKVNSDERNENFKNDYLTEKTAKALSLGMPFLLIGPPHSLKKLKSFGFKTFDKWWDESYDEELDSNRRFEMISEQILKISKYSLDDLTKIHIEMFPTLIHNRDNIQNVYKINFNNYKLIYEA